MIWEAYRLLEAVPVMMEALAMWITAAKTAQVQVQAKIVVAGRHRRAEESEDQLLEADRQGHIPSCVYLCLQLEKKMGRAKLVFAAVPVIVGAKRFPGMSQIQQVV